MQSVRFGINCNIYGYRREKECRLSSFKQSFLIDVNFLFVFFCQLWSTNTEYMCLKYIPTIPMIHFYSAMAYVSVSLSLYHFGFVCKISTKYVVLWLNRCQNRHATLYRCTNCQRCIFCTERGIVDFCHQIKLMVNYTFHLRFFSFASDDNRFFFCLHEVNKCTVYHQPDDFLNNNDKIYVHILIWFLPYLAMHVPWILP